MSAPRAAGAGAPAGGERSRERPERRLYAVATVHLDTQWRWTIQQTIRDFLPPTLEGNFALFEKYPFFTLSFEGAFRYMLMEEYYPRDFERLKGYVAAGRWRLAGSMLDAPDTNVPSPESLLRHILYGNRYFERTFGRTSCDIFLPDCFGFSHAVPSVAAHCGLLGFSSQKFGRWLAPAELPMEVGVWEGPDGAGVVAALRPEGYGEGLAEDLSQAERWVERIDRLIGASGVGVGFKYVGVGDRGGALDEASVEWLDASRQGSGPVAVTQTGSDQLFRDLGPDEVARLPRHRGELLLPRHGSGCYTSQAAMKRWNRQNEQLADAAERAAVVAGWLGALPYPHERLRQAWLRFLWHQMHDDLTGTSIPEAYRFSWNDELVALNQFADVLTASVGAVAEALDTRAEGRPVVVYNPLSIEREDLVTARLPAPGDRPLRVYGPDGAEVPSQLRVTADGRPEVTFLARLPPVGFAVYDLREAERPCEIETGLTASPTSLTSERYRVEIDPRGDVASLVDRASGRELLSGPLGLRLLRDRSRRWPAWEVLYDDLLEAGRAVRKPVRIEVTERGPARVTLEVERRAGRSSFIQRLQLAAGGAGERFEIDCDVEWLTRGRMLKAVFPLASAAPEATYDLGLGTIRRGNNRPERYEVPAQQWADLSAPGGPGVTILNDSKHGWDKPDDATLRLTLLRSPGVVRKFRHQGVQDLGRHRFRYALFGHSGDWRAAGSRWQAARLNQPLRAFHVPAGRGRLGRTFSFLEVSDEQVAVTALKRAEEGEELILRLQETSGRPAAGVEVRAAAACRSSRPLDGTERPLGDGRAATGPPAVDLGPYQPWTVALAVEPPAEPSAPPRCLPIDLPYDVVATSHHERGEGDFDGAGRCFPAELFPRHLVVNGIEHRLGPRRPGTPNALACRGQTLELAPSYRRLHFLAASADRDRSARFEVGGRAVEVEVQRYTGILGCWKGWVRGWNGKPAWKRSGGGFLRRAPVAWLATHRHDSAGRDEPYVFCYLFRYSLALPPSATAWRLPDRPEIRIFAATLADESASDVAPAVPLYD